MLILLGSGYTNLTQSQCVIPINQQVPDNGETSFSIVVDGLAQPSLDAPGQGLCGIRVKFMHELVGDLLLSLRSPSGQVIELTGPQVVTSVTGLTVFDITFIQCAELASPDPGFADQWSNDQPWGILANYSGFYYPHSGCLEDLTGSAEGLWTLIAQDAQGNDIGVIEEIELIFCIPNGIICEQCTAKGGEIATDTIEQCANEPAIDIDLSPTFTGGAPNPNIYGYFYILSREGVVQSVGSKVDNEGLIPGIYSICGISVLHADSNLIKAFPAGISIEDYEEFVLQQRICFDLSTSCAILRVKPELPPAFSSQIICQGERYGWRGSFYSVQGTYIVRNTGFNGCLRDHTLALAVIDPEPSIDVAIPFGCGVEQARLEGSDDTYGNAVDFQWYTTDGVIVSNTTNQNIAVSSSGTYHLITRYYYGSAPTSFCEDTASVTLTNDFIEPQVSFLTNQVLTCDVDSIPYISFASPSDALVIWRDQNGLEDTTQNKFVGSGETYTLIAVSAQGCRDSVSLIIPYDTFTPPISLRDTIKMCFNDTIVLNPGSFNPLVEYMWINPAGDTSRNYEIRTTDVGTFTVIASANNGCSRSGTAQIDFFGTRPQFQIVSDTFFCYTDSIPLNVTSNLSEASFRIFGPAGFRSSDHDNFIERPGNYRIRVTTTDGCVYDSVWTTPTEIDVMTTQIFGDTLDCENDTIQLSVPALGPDLEYEWRGPGGFFSQDTMPFVREGGLYSVVVTTRAGCDITGTYNVVLDTLKPNVQIEAGVLDCTTDSVRFRVMADDDAYLYNWTGPNNFESTRTRPWALELGFYQVTVTKINGCISFFSLEVTPDFDLPTFSINASPISCLSDTSVVELSTNAEFIEWNGPGFISNDTNITLPQLADYTLYLRGSNGCDTLIEFVPPVDTSTLDIQLTSDILGCNRDIVPLIYESDAPPISVIWSGPDVTNPTADTSSTRTPGIYTLSAINDNGCESIETIEVIQDFTIPDIRIGGTPALTCAVDTVNLHAITSTEDLTFQWIFPDGRTTQDSTLQTFLTGTYQLAVEAPNSCRDTAVFDVALETVIPPIVLTADSINCVNDMATLSANLRPDEIVTWTHPDQSTSMAETFMTNLPGIYKAVIFNQRTTCIDSADVEVYVDTTSIDNSISGQGRIRCRNPTARLQSAILQDDAFLQWTGPGFSSIGEDTIAAPVEGTYYLTSTLPSRCFDVDSFTIITDTIKPSIILSTDTISCGTPKVQLTFLSNVDPVTPYWVGPNGFASFDSLPFVNEGGMYILRLQERDNGCFAFDSILVVGDTLAPSVTVETDLFSCDDSTAMARAVSMDSIDRYIWLGPDNFSAMDQEVQLDRTGEFVIIAFAPNGCVGRDTFQLEEFDEIEDLSLTIDSIDCNNPIATHTVATSEDNVDISWQRAGAEVSQMMSYASDEGGLIDVILTNAKGCSKDTSFNVFLDTLAPNPMIDVDGLIKCDNREVTLRAVYDDNQNVILLWSTLDGNILTGVDSDEIIVDQAGLYQIEISNNRNGCIGQTEIDIQEAIDSLSIDALVVQQAHCNNDYVASIEVRDISGADGSLTYSINGELQTFDPLFSPLSPGDYEITVFDRFGCTDSDSATIEEVVIRFLDVARDTIVQLGQSVRIDAFTNYTDDLILSRIWSVNDTIVCDGCDSLEFVPTTSGFYALTISDTNGCLISDSVLVQVVSVPLMYFPNAFSPNNDGINDAIGPYFGNNVARVIDLSIYNRWGQRVHHRMDAPTDEDFLFWDGTQKGKALLPELFIYTIQIELIDGRRVNRQGEFHLIR